MLLQALHLEIEMKNLNHQCNATSAEGCGNSSVASPTFLRGQNSWF